MSEHVLATPVNASSVLAVQVDGNTTLSKNTTVALVIAAATVLLPADALPGKKLSVVADGGAATIDGNGSLIVSGTQPGAATFAVADGSAIELTRSVSLDWYVSNGGSAFSGLSDLAPLNVNRTAAAAGVSVLASRYDHKHDVDVAAPSTVAQANAEGAATSLSRSDHVHNHGAQPLGGGTNHAVATPNPGGFAGFMSAADKARLDAIPPSPDRAVLFSNGGAGGSIGGSTGTKIAVGGIDLEVGAANGPIATAGEIRAASGGVSGVGFEMYTRNGQDTANILTIGTYSSSSVTVPNVTTDGGYGTIPLSPHLRQFFAQESIDLKFTVLTAEGSTATWSLIRNSNGDNRRVMVSYRHVSWILQSNATSSGNIDNFLCGADGAIGLGYCVTEPTTNPGVAAGVPIYAKASKGDVYYRRTSGAIRHMFGGGDNINFVFPADADYTLTATEALSDGLVVAAGVLTAARTLRWPYPVNAGSGRIFVQNLNAQTVNVGFATGAAVAIAGGAAHWAIIFGNGANAQSIASG